MALGNERVAWFNGKIVRESEVVVPFRDQGFLRGDAVFDMTRSFNGKAFRLAEHIARLYRSLRYLDIDPGMPPAEMAAISEDVLARNRHLLGPGEDYWLAQRITAVMMAVYTLILGFVLIEEGPFDYAEWQELFAGGWMRVATLLFAASLAWHAWVGMRDIWMDYVKAAGLRLALEVLTVLLLACYLGWTVQILWR